MSTIREQRSLQCRRHGGAGPFALPGAVAVYAPDRTCDLRHLRLEVDLDFAAASLRGRCTITLSPINDGPTRLLLDAVEMTIDELTVAGAAVPFTYDGRQLAVDLGVRSAGTAVELVVAYRCAPRRGLYFIRPDELYPDRPTQAWTQGQDEDNRCWFPCFDHPHAKATSEVIATVPRAMTVLSNGSLLGASERDGRKTFHFRHDVPHSSYLVTLVAGEYVEVREQVGETELVHLVYPGREEDGQRSFGRTGEMMRLFAERIGHPYPYPRYAQVVVADFIFGGMENTSATTLTDQTLHDARAHLDFSSEPLVAHELAHQWFGDLLTCRDWSHGWLNEGFATYLEVVWKEHAEGEDEADLARLIDQEAYFTEDAGRYRRPIVTNVFHAPIDMFDHHLYEKGGAVLHMLRRRLGDDRFWRAVRHYVARHRGGSVETRDLARAVDEATGVNVDRFFDQWVFRGGHPELTVDCSWDEERRLARVQVKQTQELGREAPPYHVDLPVRFTVGDEPVEVVLSLAAADETFLIPLPSMPTQAVIDPGANLLARLEVKKPDELWRRELLAAPRAVDRLRAARALGKGGDLRSVAPLAEAGRKDPFWAVRGEAAAALATIRTAAARDAIVELTGGELHPKARRQMARALGGFRLQEEAAAAVRRLVAGDASYFVEAEAVLALGRLRTAAALPTIVEAMGRPSHLEVIRAHALTALAELRDERGIEVVLAEVVRGKPPSSRRTAITALGQLGAEHPSHQRRVLETLTELLDDPDFRARIAAVEALDALGDGRAIGALERAGADLDGRVRRRAREVARRLGESRRDKDRLDGLRDELERLREEGGRLRERVLKLEALLPPVPPKTGP